LRPRFFFGRLRIRRGMGLALPPTASAYGKKISLRVVSRC
jgi:hypothetical protein